MFKVIGCSRVLCSSIMFFSYETLTDLITLQFINQSIYILSNLKYCVMLGKTYDRFFNELDKNKVYSSYSLSKRLCPKKKYSWLKLFVH